MDRSVRGISPDYDWVPGLLSFGAASRWEKPPSLSAAEAGNLVPRAGIARIRYPALALSLLLSFVLSPLLRDDERDLPVTNP